MSLLVFGAVQLGMQYGVANSTGKPDFDLSKKMLEAAIDSGVSVIDTASAYGDSELTIGRSLDEVSKSRISIITKLDPLENLPSHASHSVCAAFVDASVYGSLIKLGIVDASIDEPLGGAHRDMDGMAASIKSHLIDQLAILEGMSEQELMARRYDRLMSYGND